MCAGSGRCSGKDISAWVSLCAAAGVVSRGQGRARRLQRGLSRRASGDAAGAGALVCIWRGLPKAPPGEAACLVGKILIILVILIFLGVIFYHGKMFLVGFVVCCGAVPVPWGSLTQWGLGCCWVSSWVPGPVKSHTMGLEGAEGSCSPCWLE